LICCFILLGLPKSIDPELSIEKIVLIRRQVVGLLRCARSPRMRQLFMDTTTEIIAISNINYPDSINYPETTTEWNSLCDDILNLCDVRQTPSYDFAPNPSIPKKVHCECALITFLHNQPSLGKVFNVLIYRCIKIVL
jgi:hypothetical protein